MQDNHLSDPEFSRCMTAYLDGALSPQEEIEFLDEVKTSPEQQARIETEKHFREFLRKHVHRKPVPPSLVDSIKSNLFAATPSKQPRA